jgi:ATP/maltotriose-dependent transcriptional regulator MalT
VLYERDELTAAHRHATRGVALCRQLAYTQPLASGLGMLARIRQAQRVLLATHRPDQAAGLPAAGRSNQQIADELVVVLDTVKKHVSHILDKLGAANRTQAVARARALGLLR